MKRILIVDDHFRVRMSLKIMLRELYSEAVLVEAENYDVLLQLISGHRFELVILDIDIPGGWGRP